MLGHSKADFDSKMIILHALEATCANSTPPSANACASAIRAHSRKDFAILSYLEVVGARRIVSSVTRSHFSHWTVLKGLRLSLSVQVALECTLTSLFLRSPVLPPSRPRPIFLYIFLILPCSTVYAQVIRQESVGVEKTRFLRAFHLRKLINLTIEWLDGAY